MTKITVRDNGPHFVSGTDVEVYDAAGNQLTPPKEGFALCRCGHSKNMPFCNGAHGKEGFIAPSNAKKDVQ